MKQVREVTELDFRMPDFRDAKVEDYEFNGSGEVVRKDRWEKAIQSIRIAVGVDGRSFHIADVVKAVTNMADDHVGFMSLSNVNDEEDMPVEGDSYKIRLNDQSLICGATYSRKTGHPAWKWRGMSFSEDDVVAWKPIRK
ncbi:hypothetical protein ACI2KR_27190 [Pseudomonas luteola]